MDNLKDIFIREISFNINAPRSLDELNAIGSSIVEKARPNLALETPYRLVFQDTCLLLRCMNGRTFWLYEVFADPNTSYIGTYYYGKDLVFIEQ